MSCLFVCTSGLGGSISVTSAHRQPEAWSGSGNDSCVLRFRRIPVMVLRFVQLSMPGQRPDVIRRFIAARASTNRRHCSIPAPCANMDPGCADATAAVCPQLRTMDIGHQWAGNLNERLIRFNLRVQYSPILGESSRGFVMEVRHLSGSPRAKIHPFGQTKEILLLTPGREEACGAHPDRRGRAVGTTALVCRENRTRGSAPRRARISRRGGRDRI